MAGKALPLFSDFLAATRDTQLTGGKDILNDSVAYNTFLLKSMIQGRPSESIVQGGTQITERIQLTPGSTYQNYLPNEDMNVTGYDSLTTITVPWRFSRSSYVWTDQETLLNSNTDWKISYKDLKKVKEQAAATDMWVGMEAALWAAPNSTEMEVTNSSGRMPYSLRCFITEDGLPPSASNGGIASGTSTWTTIEGVTDQVNFRNPYETYVVADIATTLRSKMHALFLKVNYEAPESNQEYFTNTRTNKMKILTNNDGYVKYADITTDSNDRLMPAGDAGWAAAANTLFFRGIPLKYIAAMDGLGYAAGEPRYWFLDCEYIHPVFHAKRYMEDNGPHDGGYQQPETHVMHKLSYWNLICKSRKRQGIVSPV